jgi:hypothetical protein
MGFSTHLLEIHLTVALRCFLKTGSVRLRSSKLRMLYPLVPKQFASTDRRHKLPATSRNYSQVPNEIMSSNARERELGRIAKRLAELAAERQALESARAALVGAVAEQSPARSIFTQQAAPQDKNSSSETKHANPNAPVNTDSRTSSSRALPLSESWPYRRCGSELVRRSHGVGSAVGAIARSHTACTLADALSGCPGQQRVAVQVGTRD